MICCWCGREANLEESIWGLHAGLRVHLWCFFDYVMDRRIDRRELVEQLDLGGEG